jgi:hypothetical protein
MLFAGGKAIDLIFIGDKLKGLRAFLLDWIDHQTQIKRTEGKTPIFSVNFKKATGL